MKDHVRAEGIVAAMGAANDGIVIERDVVAVAGARATEALRARGLLLRVGNGVWRLRDHPWDVRAQLRAGLALSGAGAVIGLRSAARLLEFHAYGRAVEVEVLTLRGRNVRQGHLRVVQTRVLRPEHVTVVDGFPVTAPARTFFDLCGDPDFDLPVAHPVHQQRMARVYNDALARRGLRFAHEAAVLVALARRGRAGTVLVRELLDRYGPMYEPTRSDLESLFVELVEEHGLPGPDKQVALSDERGFIGVVDFLWPGRRLVVEVDSRWHDGPLDQESDVERDERLRAAGYVVRRYRYRDLVLRPTAVIAELVMLLAA